MNDFDFGWVVGLMEGEGCFGINRQRDYKRHTDSIYTSPCVQLVSGDLDVVERAHALLNVSAGIFPRGKVKDHHTQMYCFKQTGSRAREIMEMLLPHMSARRAERIREVLASC